MDIFLSCLILCGDEIVSFAKFENHLILVEFSVREREGEGLGN